MEQNKLVIFVVLGRLGKNLSISKLAPICQIESVSKVYAFCESDGIEFNEKLSYIILPKFIAGIRPNMLSRLIRVFYEPLQLFFYSIKYRPDFINGVYLLPKGLNSLIVSRLSGIKCIISIIGSKEEVESELRIPRFWKALNLFVLKHCWAITCKGGMDIHYLIQNGIARNKIFVYNGGIDTDLFKNRTVDRNTHLIFVGKFEMNKGPFRMLAIIQQLVLIMKDFKCIMLGDGQLKQSFEREVIKLDLQDNVYCLGHVEKLTQYYQQSKIFVLPSTNEGLSTAMLESMSCGCVPVVSNVGNMSEAVENDINGFLIEKYDDINSFVGCILKLLQDNEKWTVFSHRAINKVYNNYSYPIQAKLYETIVNRKIKL